MQIYQKFCVRLPSRNDDEGKQSSFYTMDVVYQSRLMKKKNGLMDVRNRALNTQYRSPLIYTFFPHHKSRSFPLTLKIGDLLTALVANIIKFLLIKYPQKVYWRISCIHRFKTCTS